MNGYPCHSRFGTLKKTLTAQCLLVPSIGQNLQHIIGNGVKGFQFMRRTSQISCLTKTQGTYTDVLTGHPITNIVTAGEKVIFFIIKQRFKVTFKGLAMDGKDISNMKTGI